MRNTLYAATLISLASTGVFITGCTQQTASPVDHPAATVADDSVYAQLGGDEGLKKITAALSDKLKGDTTLPASLADFETKFAAMVPSLAGAPGLYTGPDAKTAAKGLNITEDQWTAMVKDLTAVLNEQGVAPIARELLLVKVSPIKADVVGQ